MIKIKLDTERRSNQVVVFPDQSEIRGQGREFVDRVGQKIVSLPGGLDLRSIPTFYSEWIIEVFDARHSYSRFRWIQVLFSIGDQLVVRHGDSWLALHNRPDNVYSWHRALVEIDRLISLSTSDQDRVYYENQRQFVVEAVQSLPEAS